MRGGILAIFGYRIQTNSELHNSCHTCCYQITHSCESSLLRSNIHGILKRHSAERRKPDAHPLGPLCDGEVDVTKRLAGGAGAGQRVHGESRELSRQLEHVELGAVADRRNTENGVIKVIVKGGKNPPRLWG